MNHSPIHWNTFLPEFPRRVDVRCSCGRIWRSLFHSYSPKCEQSGNRSAGMKITSTRNMRNGLMGTVPFRYLLLLRIHLHWSRPLHVVALLRTSSHQVQDRNERWPWKSVQRWLQASWHMLLKSAFGLQDNWMLRMLWRQCNADESTGSYKVSKSFWNKTWRTIRQMLRFPIWWIVNCRRVTTKHWDHWVLESIVVWFLRKPKNCVIHPVGLPLLQRAKQKFSYRRGYRLRWTIVFSVFYYFNVKLFRVQLTRM